MKKTFLLVLMTLTMSLSGLFAENGSSGRNIAIGPIFSGNFGGIDGTLGGLGITGKLPNLPPIFGLNFSFGPSTSFIGVTGDWWLYEQAIYAPANLDLYVGPGFFTDLNISKVSKFDFGLRIPVGISWRTPIKVLEAFVELAPAFGIAINGKDDQTIAPTWRVQGAVGGRFWF